MHRLIFFSVATDYYSQACKDDSELGAVIGGVVAVVIIVSVTVVIVITVVMVFRCHQRRNDPTAEIELKYVIHYPVYCCVCSCIHALLLDTFL